ncbi:uncharacterized protein LOC133172341 isoform X1 [Saccostrea echinata]|uniref:uncharacterized protein LOC133172341 isoform X1 n=1 Tax=Saccostrea echinata TaxID=191078 RepID=UPI002A816D7F|nr:uncharacterized protein LOC133172341 isoform X1 [Saccostrea echinata]
MDKDQAVDTTTVEKCLTDMTLQGNLQKPEADGTSKEKPIVLPDDSPGMGGKEEQPTSSSTEGPYGLPSRLDDDVAFPTDIKLERPDDCTPEDDKDFKICVVCGERASGYYFGALVCLPCKSFYIRCTKDGEPTFTCQCNGNCDIAKQGRIRCQYCRYQRCLMAGMCRKEKPETVQPADGQVLCKVCGDIANGIHFGVNTCEGCKKFFRRGLVENQSYLCKSEKKCTINPRNRNNCRYCRYQKCISVGMSREAIKMGRPKKAETTETNNSANVADATESPSISPIPSPTLNFSPGSSPSRHQVNDNMFDLSKVKAEPSNCDLTNLSATSLNNSTAEVNLPKATYSSPAQSFSIPYTESWSTSAQHDMHWSQNQRTPNINWHQEIAHSVAQQQMVSSVTTSQTAAMSVSNTMPVQNSAIQSNNVVYEEDDMDDILAYLSQEQNPMGPKKSCMQGIPEQVPNQNFSSESGMQHQACMMNTQSSVPNFPIPSPKQFKQQINDFNNQMLQNDGYGQLNVDTSPAHSSCSNTVSYPSPTYQYGNGSPHHYSGQTSPEHSYGPHSPPCMPPSPQYQQQSSPYSPCQYQNSPSEANHYHANSPPVASPGYPSSPSNNRFSPMMPYPQNTYAQGPPAGGMMGDNHSKELPYADMKAQMKINQMFMNCDDNVQNYPEESASGFFSRTDFDRHLILKTLQNYRGTGPEYCSSPESSPHSYHDNSDDSNEAFYTNSCGQKRKACSPMGLHYGSMANNGFYAENEKDFQCENYSMMKSQAYWNEPLRLSAQGPPSEDMIAFTNHIVAGYSKFVASCDESKKHSYDDILKSQWPAFGKEESHWNHVQRRVIRNIVSFMNFIRTVPGFENINTEDAAELCMLNCFHIGLIVAANNYYDKESKRFKYFWNWTLSPNNPMYFFKLRLLQCGEQLSQLNMTLMEETFLSIILFLSTDLLNLRDPATLESLRQNMIHIFQAQLLAQGVDPIKRIQELFSVMPECRHCSMWHKQLMRKMKINMEIQEVHQLFDKLDLEIH